MKYSRTMVLQSAHFNGQPAYDAFKNAQFEAETGDWMTAYSMLLNSVLPDLHGHNFVVTVDIECTSGINDHGGAGNDYAVNDKAIVAILEQYNNTNLSVHPAFVVHDWRATTERLVEVIMADVEVELRGMPDHRSWLIKVKVWENPDISASAEARIR